MSGPSKAVRRADSVYPSLPKGPHHLSREKQRRAFLLGFAAGYREAKANPNPDASP